ncbi:hypothetical protein EZV73_27370 [Acidaminobacter sp. JC074]|uniref:hypothetical protein n=1 Tax=Acidaminobacter sp. JC074 TaxID=2530199 RepID=UPI001F111EF9|nr:hypothetical protein [Acidaminobacter sp. JC074]MCH4891321.1 hypothetical protein [Acidaminobacter sp. JC074]
MTHYNSLVRAINNRVLVNLTFNSNEKGIISRLCVPFDYGPSRRYRDCQDRFHFYDLDSPDGNHNLSILPNQVITISLTSRNFEPGDYVHWEPQWHVSRDWGRYS